MLCFLLGRLDLPVFCRCLCVCCCGFSGCNIELAIMYDTMNKHQQCLTYNLISPQGLRYVSNKYRSVLNGYSMPTCDSCGVLPALATEEEEPRHSEVALSARISVAASETEEYSSSPMVSSPITRRLAQSVC